MLYIKWFRSKAQKVTGFILLLFVMSFGLQSTQDLLTQLPSCKTIDLNHPTFNKFHQTINQISGLDDDDQDTINHPSQILFSSYFIKSTFLLFSFKNYDEGEKASINACLHQPITGLFISNRTLLI